MSEKIHARACGENGTVVVSFDAPDLPRGEPAGRCVHYTGLFGPGMTKHSHCAAGVAYAEVRVDHEPIAYVNRGTRYTARRSIPCSATINYCGATCEKLQWPTAEQVAQHEAYNNALVANLTAALRTTEAPVTQEEA